MPRTTLKDANATRLSDKDIDAIYDYFENGKGGGQALMTIVGGKKSFTKSMGRNVNYRPDGSIRMRAA